MTEKHYLRQGDHLKISGGTGVGQIIRGIARFPRDSMAFFLAQTKLMILWQ